MNRLSLATLIASSFVVQSAPAAFANGFSVKKDELEKVEFYKARRKVDILEEGPIINDRRTAPAASKIYQINLPPLATPSPTITQINVPGTPQGQGLIYVDSGTPPPAGFESNMRSLQSRDGLPGTKMGVMRNHSVNGHMKAPAKPDNGLKIKPANSAPQRVFKYTNMDSGSITGSTGNSSKTRVTGTIKSPIKKGDLLKNAGK